MSNNFQNLPLAYPYVPPQHFNERYSDEDAIIRGTMFPELDLPFHDFQINSPLSQTPMTELMMLEFVCLEFRLYLDTHPDDEVALAYYNEYKYKSDEAKARLRNSQENHYYNSWVYAPWPWEGEE